MEKTIKLIMRENEDIDIFLDGTLMHKIGEEKTVSAEKIFEVFQFVRGNRYVLETECESESAKGVLEFFSKLFGDIIKNVNEKLGVI